VVANKVIGLQRQEPPVSRLLSNAGFLFGCRAFASRRVTVAPSAGATSTQRFPSASGVSPMSLKANERVKKAMAAL
jgi:hypothetical protein